MLAGPATMPNVEAGPVKADASVFCYPFLCQLKSRQ